MGNNGNDYINLKYCLNTEKKNHKVLLQVNDYPENVLQSLKIKIILKLYLATQRCKGLYF